MSETELRIQVVQEAMTWLRTPHHPCTRSKGAGVDCFQLVLAVYAAVGLIPDLPLVPYPYDFHMHMKVELILTKIERFAHKIPGPPLPGDLVLYRDGPFVNHGAIVVEWPTIIHATRECGMVTLDNAMGNLLVPLQAGFWSPFESAEGCQ